jgi:hypothetical protein
LDVQLHRRGNRGWSDNGHRREVAPSQCKGDESRHEWSHKPHLFNEHWRALKEPRRERSNWAAAGWKLARDVTVFIAALSLVLAAESGNARAADSILFVGNSFTFAALSPVVKYRVGPITAMGKELRAAYDLAATGSPLITGVIPVGDAWNRAFDTGFADPNPYDGIQSGQVNLWANDGHHASTYGYYLEALMVFGNVTGRDPGSLGPGETAAAELGVLPAQAQALQQIAHDELEAQRQHGGVNKRWR